MDLLGKPFTVEALAAKVREMLDGARTPARLLDALGLERVHICGISIGGRIAMEMAAAAPDRVASLVLCDTALEFRPPEMWQQRMDAVTRGGM